MFRYLRVKSKPEVVTAPSGDPQPEALTRDSQSPIRLAQINDLPVPLKQRLYRGLVPASLLVKYGIDPISWMELGGAMRVQLEARGGVAVVRITAGKTAAPRDAFYHVELADNPFGGIDLNFLILSDPDSPYFATDFDEQGNPTLFGTVRRNLEAEQQAMAAGLAPAQVRSSLGASRDALQQLEAFLVVLGQRAIFLEPLTYASAWVFERRGFAYVRGHKLMDEIHMQFQPGGLLHQALDNSTAFRKPEQWNTVRGRAWAIHDDILQVIDQHWDKLRMVKQVGRHAGVETFPQASY